MAEATHDPKARFSDRVDDYIKYRPHYPQDVLQAVEAACGLRPEHTIADVGCGTGLLAEIFLENGNRVVVMAGGRSLRPDALAANDSLSLTIPPGRGGIEIHYTALSFQAPRKNRFKYLLEGVDPEWVDAGARRSVSYNSVTPGKHLFRVVASNNDGVWNETGATLSLLFVPHYWQTWWFKPVLGLAALLVLTLLHRKSVPSG